MANSDNQNQNKVTPDQSKQGDVNPVVSTDQEPVNLTPDSAKPVQPDQNTVSKSKDQESK